MNSNIAKTSLLGKTLAELRTLVTEMGWPAYLGNQLAYWLYKTDVATFDEMGNISKKVRVQLDENFAISAQPPVKVAVSDDGTKKYLFPAGERFIETAFIPETKRNTLCVSSQVGCRMGCKFCATGKQGFMGNLTAGQIINQLRSLPERESVTNLVFMGMGEPFDNATEVMRAIEIFTVEYGFSIGIRKVTVSTIGIVPEMEKFIRESKCNLAVSLHTPFDEERLKIMPVQHAYPIKQVIQSIAGANPDKYRRLSLEYIVFGGFNDTPRHIKELARLLNKVRCRINLIRFHEVPGVDLPATDEKRLLEFQRELNDKGIVTTLRTSRGLDIKAACGLLSTSEMNGSTTLFVGQPVLPDDYI